MPLTHDQVSLHKALWEVVVAAELWRSPLVPVIKDGGAQRVALGPLGVARADFWTADPNECRESLTKLKLPLVLACHYGAADLTSFRSDGRVADHMTRLASAAGGLVTLLPFQSQRQGDGHGKFWQSLIISARDTMAHAPAGKKSLKDLGKACGVPKIEVPDGWIGNMSDYRARHLTDFLEYGINNSVIVVEYLARLWGEGVLPPITLSGGAASALVDSGKAYFEASPSGEFRRMFAGLVDEDEAVDAVEDEDRLAFYAKRGRNPIDDAAAQLSSAFARAYHGGLNSCPMPGYYPVPTVDIDAQNYYPTAIACVEDLDWGACAIEEVLHETWLVRDTVASPTTPSVGFVSFKFPQDIMYPCLPVVTDGTFVYPRTSESTAGTWVCGPELWLALQLGAEVYCQIGFLGRGLDGPDDGRSLSLRRGVKQLSDDRNVTKRLFGKGSIEEQPLKTGVNSVYGKTAQDVAEQRVSKIGIEKVSKAAQRVDVVLDKADELVVEVGCVERRLQNLEGRVTWTAVGRLSLALLPLAAVLLVIGGLVSGIAYAAGFGPLLGWAWGSFSAAEAWWAKVLIALGTLGDVSAFGAVIWWLAKRLGEDFRHW